MNPFRSFGLRLGFVLGLTALAAAYWAGAQLGFTLAFSVRQVSPVWPPTGIALAALIRFGSRCWPGVLAGAFLANFGVGESFLTAVGIAGGNTVEALTSAAILRQIFRFRAEVDRVRDVLALLLAALVSSALAASIGVTSLSLGHLLPDPDIASAWLVWWVGDTAGALVVTPLLLTITRPPVRAAGLAETVALFATLVAVGLAVFVLVPPTQEPLARLEYLVFPVLIWTALRFSQREVALAVVLVATFAIVGAIHDRGPFAVGALTARLVMLQLFVAVVAVTALALGALVTERRSSEEERSRLLGQERAARAETEAAYREVQRANASKDEFLAVLSHELRTPLTPILGWTRLLREADLDEATRARALESIERNAGAQVRLVEDLLDVSRIVSGKMTFERRRVDLSEVASRAEETVRQAAEKKSLSLSIRLPSAPALLWGDRERLQQAVVNLLANAVKFTPAGGRIELTVATHGIEHVVTVEDTGMGIDAEFLPKMFAPFTQSDAGTTRAHSGLGLGLSIVRYITLHHGGSVSAASEGYGQGATVVLRLPRAEAELELEPARDIARAAEAGEKRRLAGLTVLVVDDEPDTREWMGELLRRQGAEVRIHATADQALRTLLSWQPQVLVSDLAMPDKDGLAFIREVRASGDRSRRVRAVLLTAYAGEDERRRALEAGYDAHLVKPVAPDDLVAALVAVAEAPPEAPRG